jgi:hypothetical protein
MVSSTGLIPIVSGVGLAVLANAMSHGGVGAPRSALLDFVFLVVGFAIVSAALLVLGDSVETGRRLDPGSARAENRLIVALFLLLGVMAARAAWTRFFHFDQIEPWERGLLDRLPQLLMFLLATMIVVLVGAALDEGLIALRAVRGPSIGYVGAALALALLTGWMAMRLIGGGNPSPRAFGRSRRQQVRLLAALSDAPGAWTPVRVQAIGDLCPPCSLTATIWISARGGFWRDEDGFALPRYHAWAANHVSEPNDALHAQRLTFFAGSQAASMRGLRVTRTTRRWLWWVDVVQQHWRQAAVDADPSSAERTAGLTLITDQQLRVAGLKLVRVDRATPTAATPWRAC